LNSISQFNSTLVGTTLKQEHKYYRKDIIFVLKTYN